VLTPLVEKQLADRAKQEGTDVDHEKLQFLTEKQPMTQSSTGAAIGALTAFLAPTMPELLPVHRFPLTADGLPGSWGSFVLFP
jgi:hypothetical protein